LVQYYDLLAGHYDAYRFGNSYGRYVDAQKRRVLCRWLAPFRAGRSWTLRAARAGLQTPAAFIGAEGARKGNKGGVDTL
jgi:hypothetical protein